MSEVPSPESRVPTGQDEIDGYPRGSLGYERRRIIAELNRLAGQLEEEPGPFRVPRRRYAAGLRAKARAFDVEMDALLTNSLAMVMGDTFGPRHAAAIRGEPFEGHLDDDDMEDA